MKKRALRILGILSLLLGVIIFLKEIEKILSKINLKRSIYETKNIK